MNLFETLDEIVKDLKEAGCQAECRTAYSAALSSHLLETPVLVLDAEYREAAGETGGVIFGDLYQPPQAAARGRDAEEIFALLLQIVCRRLPGVTGISRNIVKASGRATVSRCQISLNLAGAFHGFQINGTAMKAASVSVTLEQERREIYPIGETRAAWAVPAKQRYRGVITGCNLGEAEVLPVFSLEWGDYRYEDCCWTCLRYGSSGMVQKAEFTAGRREKKVSGA